MKSYGTNFLKKSINHQVNSSVKAEDDKIVISLKELDNNNPNLKDVKPDLIEFQKRVYEKMCRNLGLDVSRGELILERSKDTDTCEDNEIKVDITENKAIVSSNAFDKYKQIHSNLMQKINERINQDESIGNVNKETLEMILKIQHTILEFIKNYI